ncbi:MAG TPA: 2-phosphosulfolactate phosphatase [Acidimicrobiales bacterium]|nr:2-phosphosulfolactate phosphatase [Acidimicrobiales bacterium]
MSRSVVIDCFPEHVERYADGWAVVAVDVIRATTTAITAVDLGHPCYPVPTLEVAVALSARLDNPLLIGELGGKVPYGFDLGNSPADVSLLTERSRPLILLSTSGTRLMCNATSSDAAYVACLRNLSGQVAYLAGRHDRIAVVGAGARGEFREEDQLCCAWLAEGLCGHGYAPADEQTAEIVQRWHGASVDAINQGASARYLRETAQMHDLDFVVHHVDDIDGAFAVVDEQVVRVS